MDEASGQADRYGNDPGKDPSDVLAVALQQLAQADYVARIAAVAVQAARAACGADAAFLALREGNLCHYLDVDAAIPLWQGQHFPLGSCVAGRAIATSAPVFVPDLAADARAPGEGLRPSPVKALLMVPLQPSAPLGALGIGWNGEHAASPGELHLLETLAEATAAALARLPDLPRQQQGLRQRTQARLRQVAHRRPSEAAPRRTLPARLARETGNPLAPIHEAIRRLHGKADSSPGADAARHLGNGQVRRLALAITDFLDLDRIAGGRLKLRRAPVELAPLVEQARDIALSRCDPEHRALGIALPPEPILLQVDPVRLTRVLVDLLDQCGGSGEDPGRMALTATLVDDRVEIRLCDCGGPQPAVVAHAPGGDPLALARGLVELHGGDLEIRREAKGGSVEYLLHLPVQVRGEAVDGNQAARDATTSGARILLAAAAELGEPLALLLGLCGNQVTSTMDAAAVVSQARARPDLVLLDLGLPNDEGYRACRRIREQEWGKDLRILALAERGTEVAAAGFDGWLEKPLPATNLAGVVAAALPQETAPPPRRRQSAALTREIEARQQAEAQARAMAEQLTAVLSTLPDALIGIDATRRIVYFNQAAEALFRCTADAAIGQPLARFIPDTLRAAAPMEVQTFLDSGSRTRPLLALDNRQGLRGDGSSMAISAAISNIDSSGPLLATLVVHDASRLVELEAALATQRTHLGYISEAAAVGYWDWDVAGDRLEWSPRFMDLCGIPPGAEMNYKRFLAAVHPDDRKRVYAAIHGTLAGESDYDSQFRTQRRDGQLRWVHALGRAEFGDDGRPRRMSGIAMDITDRRNLESSARDGEARFRELADAAPAMLWMTAADGSPTFLSRGWKEFAGHDLNWLDALHEEDRGALVEHFHGGKTRHDAFAHEVRVRRGGDDWRWVLAAGRPHFIGDAFAGYVGSLVDIDTQKRYERHIRDAAMHDPLTGLPNRKLIFEYGGHQLAAAQRRHGGVALLFVVLNRFRSINNRYGRDAGDAVLQEVARRLGEFTRHEDMVGRLGGDEFVILLPHLDANRQRAAIVAKHVLECIARPVPVAGQNIQVTPAIGISCYPEHGIDIQALVRAADLAMNQAKHKRSANYLFYSRDLEHRADEAAVLTARLRHALRSGGLVVHYQPVIDIRSGRLIAAEALVRLMGEEGETIAPQRFIRIAEAQGLIGELDEWVAETACRQQGEWQKQGLPPLSIAINASPIEFQHREFPDRLRRILADTGMDPARLQLELTESTLQTGSHEVIDSLHRLKALGIQVAVDEFGSGDSDIQVLSNLPVDLLKIDQSFVKRLEHDETSLAVAKSIIALGHHLSLEVVGQGIESATALRHLRENGCNSAQGFLVSRPLPPDEFAHWCRSYTH